MRVRDVVAPPLLLSPFPDCSLHNCCFGLGGGFPTHFPQWVIVVAQYPQRECCRNEGQGCGTLSHTTGHCCLLSPSRAVTSPNRHFLPSQPQTGLPLTSQSSCPSPKAHRCKDSQCSVDGSASFRLKTLWSSYRSSGIWQISVTSNGHCPSASWTWTRSRNVKYPCPLPPITFSTSLRKPWTQIEEVLCVRMGWISLAPFLLVVVLWIPPAAPICYDQVYYSLDLLELQVQRLFQP